MAHTSFTRGTIPFEGDRANSIVFDATGRYMVADTRIFTSNTEWVDLQIEAGTLVAHPTRPFVANVREDGFDLIDLATKTHRAVALEETDSGTFSHDGERFAVACYETNEIRIFDLDGNRASVLRAPEQWTAPGLCFSRKAPEILAFNDSAVVALVPLSGAASRELPLKKSKVLSGRCIAFDDAVLYEDSANLSLVSYEGELRWALRAEHESVARVPGTNVIALVRMGKKSISYLDANGKEIASTKIKITAAPLGFACNATHAAWAQDGCVCLVEHPRF